MENTGSREFSGGDIQIGLKSKEAGKFKATLTQIQSRPLSPDNIDSYAEHALLDLIKLTTSITREYVTQKEPLSLKPDKELEDRAFSYFGLENIEEVLTHVALTDEEIKKLDGTIAKAKNADTIIVPPNPEAHSINNGDGTFKEKSIISRTKTALFILSKDFDIDIEDPEQLTLTKGMLSDTMMRKLAYYMITVPKLNRTILCCDEEGNVTYIFDNSVLVKHEISQEDLATLSKTDINDLLQDDPTLGKRVVYSNKFVPNMINLITDLGTKNIDQESKGLGQYLYPKAPEGILSSWGLAKELCIGHDTISRIIKELEDSLGPRASYRFRSKVANGLTPEQQKMIREEAKSKGLFLEQAPQGILSNWGLAKELGLGHYTIAEIIEELGDSLGPITSYRFGANATNGFTPEQQAMIREEHERRKLKKTH